MAVDTIRDGVVVSMSYVLKVDGQEVGRADADDPLEYLHGAENIVPGLEAALEGKRVGDRVDVTVPPEDAYGDYDEEDIDEFDKDEIPGAENLETGMVVEVEDEDGYVYIGMVKEVKADTVLVDFNPPLAGKTLSFSVEVLKLREADEEELDHGHPHSLDDFYEDEDEE
jgi:FKBP-type peptidyl-prolyl cis-trans isomerase SlyD